MRFALSLPEPIELLRQERIKKLDKIRDLGFDPYPSRWVHQNQREPIAKAREKILDSPVFISGRLIAQRKHGALTFADLNDESGRIQLLFSKKELSDLLNQLLDLLDLGDFIGISGVLLKTASGELSARVSDFSILTKSLRPLPSAFYGLKDVEERYRKRYLDLLANPEVKKFFELRSKVIEGIRRFLIDKKGYIEVETPILQPIYGGGLARPFKTHHHALNQELYLRIATELYLKRLIVGGFEKVFEINRVFRNEGVDTKHNPEFTLLETMEAFADYQKNMGLVEEMFETVVKKILGTTIIKYSSSEIDFKRPWKRVALWDLIKEKTGVDFWKISEKEAEKLVEKYHLNIDKYKQSLSEPRSLKQSLRPEDSGLKQSLRSAELQKTVGSISVALFEEVLAKDLIQPTLVTNYPQEIAPLAKKCQNDKRLVENFEIYINGLECGTNYSELNDPLELRDRLLDERRKEKLGDSEAHQMDNDFIEALEYGMPPTSGIGPGIDRIVMILANVASIREVILFPTLRGKAELNK